MFGFIGIMTSVFILRFWPRFIYLWLPIGLIMDIYLIQPVGTVWIKTAVFGLVTQVILLPSNRTK